MRYTNTYYSLPSWAQVLYGLLPCFFLSYMFQAYMKTSGWRKKQVLQKINTYEGRELGVHTGELKQIVKTAWLCTVCNKIFNTKEEGEMHECRDKRD